jgi:hypothetical protein
MRNKKLLGALALTGVTAILASCATMTNMMPGGQSLALAGTNEVPPVTTTATGTGTVTVSSTAA